MITVEVPQLKLAIKQEPNGVAIIYGEGAARLMLPPFGPDLQEVIDGIVLVANAHEQEQLRRQKWGGRKEE